MAFERLKLLLARLLSPVIPKEFHYKGQFFVYACTSISVIIILSIFVHQTESDSCVDYLTTETTNRPVFLPIKLDDSKSLNYDIDSGNNKWTINVASTFACYCDVNHYDCSHLDSTSPIRFYNGSTFTDVELPYFTIQNVTILDTQSFNTSEGFTCDLSLIATVQYSSWCTPTNRQNSSGIIHELDVSLNISRYIIGYYYDFQEISAPNPCNISNKVYYDQLTVLDRSLLSFYSFKPTQMGVFIETICPTRLNVIYTGFFYSSLGVAVATYCLLVAQEPSEEVIDFIEKEPWRESFSRAKVPNDSSDPKDISKTEDPSNSTK